MANRTTSICEGRPLLDLVSYARRGPRQRDRLSREEIEHISRTVRRVPEGMVKVSGGDASPEAVLAHLKYIERRGELEIEGVPANATERAVRGQEATRKTDGIYLAMRRGESTHMYERAQEAARDGSLRNVSNDPAKTGLLNTRRIVQQGWAGAAELLREQRLRDLAFGIERFVGEMPAVRTESEVLIERLLA